MPRQRGRGAGLMMGLSTTMRWPQDGHSQIRDSKRFLRSGADPRRAGAWSGMVARTLHNDAPSFSLGDVKFVIGHPQCGLAIGALTVPSRLADGLMRGEGR